MSANGTNAPLLEIEDLRIVFRDGRKSVRALNGVSLEVRSGERLGLVGESGSGKSTLALAIMGYVAPGAAVRGGAVRYRGANVLSMRAHSLRRLRAGELAFVQQEPMATLNPGLTVGAQLRETPSLQKFDELDRRIATALADVRLANPARVLRSYPHQLSGGQLQRVAIAMALLGEPRLLLLDEPTTALDTATEAKIVALLESVCAGRNVTVIHVSHDRDLLAATCDRVVTMHGGRIVSDGISDGLSGGPARPPGLPHTGPDVGADKDEAILSVAGLFKTFDETDRWSRTTGRVEALAGVDVRIRRGETLAVVGESGSGKSTLGRIVAGLETATDGRVVLDGTDVADIPATRRPARLRKAVQVIFQDPDGSLNPRLTVGHQIGRAVRAGGYAKSASDRAREVRALLESVRLESDIAGRRPRDLSGGQKQRVAIACAFAVRPRVIVADEPVSALDAETRGAVLELLAGLQREHCVSLLLISHDLAVVRSLADRVVVLYRGRVMEQGRAEVVLWPPSHPYTEMLLAASRRRTVSRQVRPSQAETGKGCPFAAHCSYRIAGTCETILPPVRIPGWEHSIHCHLALEALPYSGD